MYSSNPETNNIFSVFSFDDFPYVIESAKESIRQRYSLLKHFYSEYVFANGTGMIFRPI